MNATTAIAYAVRVIRTPKEGEPYECYLARADVRGRALALSEARLFSDAAAAALAAVTKVRLEGDQALDRQMIVS
jgi:hypothetical protein